MLEQALGCLCKCSICQGRVLVSWMQTYARGEVAMVGLDLAESCDHSSNQFAVGLMLGALKRARYSFASSTPVDDPTARDGR